MTNAAAPQQNREPTGLLILALIWRHIKRSSLVTSATFGGTITLQRKGVTL